MVDMIPGRPGEPAAEQPDLEVLKLFLCARGAVKAPDAPPKRRASALVRTTRSAYMCELLARLSLTVEETAETCVTLNVGTPAGDIQIVSEVKRWDSVVHVAGVHI